MSLIPPNLDDRNFEQLLEAARRRIAQGCPAWTDLSPSDPGGALLDVFAYLTELMLYRLNRIPEKAYVEFLRLIGVRVFPPTAASAMLRFSRAQPADSPLEIPRGTRVGVARADGRGESPVFTTGETVVLGPGESVKEARAYHCDWVEAELAGRGSGLPGLQVAAARPPIVAATDDGLDWVVGVEADPEDGAGTGRALRHGDKIYRIWREVPNFTHLGDDRWVYVADRLSGRIQFAPALCATGEDGALAEIPEALAAVPGAGREIRLWYRRGGGALGNLAADTLTVLKDPLPGLRVSNPRPATGGRSAETLENALLRGPQELHSLRRAVTARDFELVAIRGSGAVDRARAFTQAEHWVHAPPGTVEVRLVPHVPAASRAAGPLTAQTMRDHQDEQARRAIARMLEERRPLGTRCAVQWTRYKSVRARVKVMVYREENAAAVRTRLVERLNQMLAPLPAPATGAGWPFGQPLSVWDIYRIAASEPGVKAVEPPRLLVDEAPARQVNTLAADAFQDQTWYAGAGTTVFRSQNDGRGWEAVGRFPDETVALIRGYPRETDRGAGRAGLVAVASQLRDGAGGSRLRLSRDCGESWQEPRQMQFAIEDMAWLEREGEPRLLLATELGLYELSLAAEAGPLQIAVDAADPDLGFYAVAVAANVWGGSSVAVAARGDRGVLLSSAEGRPHTFDPIGLERELVRVLAVQFSGPHQYLWAGLAAVGTDPGQGCQRWRLTGATASPEGWRPHASGWEGGSCEALAFQGATVLAASRRRGVLRLDTQAREPRWEAAAVGCGLPLRDVGRLQPVDALASDPGGQRILAGGIEGVYRSDDHGVHYQNCSRTEFADEVTLPETWLFCSGAHEVSVASEDEA